jgi:hypothetical protein
MTYAIVRSCKERGDGACQPERSCAGSRKLRQVIHERGEARKDTQSGSYQWQLQLQAGEVTLKVPTLLTLPFETAIVEC